MKLKESGDVCLEREKKKKKNVVATNDVSRNFLLFKNLYIKYPRSITNIYIFFSRVFEEKVCGKLERRIKYLGEKNGAPNEIEVDS